MAPARRESNKHAVGSACNSPASSWAPDDSVLSQPPRGAERYMKIFFLILGPTRQVHGSERTGFVCVSRRPFSALCKRACFCQATDGRKEETSKGHVCPPGSRAKMLGGLPVAHQGPCPPLPRPTLPLHLQGALLKSHVADRIFRGTARQVDTEPRKAQDCAVCRAARPPPSAV